MWVIYAFSAALFAGITSILAKIGIQNTDSNLATALRTGIVVILPGSLYLRETFTILFTTSA